MPELPEVETVRRTLLLQCEGATVKSVTIRRHDLRWPIPDNLPALIQGQPIVRMKRRGKYLLFEFEHGTMLIHLGMSGVLKMVDANNPIGKHDHIDIHLNNGVCLRLNDTRRFGAVLWSALNQLHPLLASLGPEPLSEEFNAKLLYARSRGKKTSIKSFIMDSHVVVGVGNIYANEALFRAKIHPETISQNISQMDCENLVAAIKFVLARAIEQGGTTLKDYRDGRGKPGYFQQELCVYGRKGQPCLVCSSILVEIRLGQRTTVYCSCCQVIQK